MDVIKNVMKEELNRKFENHLVEFDTTKITTDSHVVMMVCNLGTYVIIKHNPDVDEETFESVLENEETYYECMSSPINEDPKFDTVRYAISLTIFIADKYKLHHVLWVEDETYKQYVDKAIIGGEAIEN